MFGSMIEEITDIVCNKMSVGIYVFTSILMYISLGYRIVNKKFMQSNWKWIFVNFAVVPFIVLFLFYFLEEKIVLTFILFYALSRIFKQYY